MTIFNELKNKFEQLEYDTVSDSFGGNRLPGNRAPAFSFAPIMKWLGISLSQNDGCIFEDFNRMKQTMNPQVLKYTLECLGRFSFCIELTNLGITSTKMKTKWVKGKIIKTMPSSFVNFEGVFAPGSDPRSSNYPECYAVLCKCIELLSNSQDHKSIMADFTKQANRNTPYESVFTYINPQLNPLHVAENIRLVELTDAKWLIQARAIIRPVIGGYGEDGDKVKCISKISTKCYKTDRSQTGEEQTNRAKRWECLATDFQHATIEDCWSVERKLLSDISHFDGFPDNSKQLLIASNLFDDTQGTALCPITLQPMIFSELLAGGSHGESTFQVGHIIPLKAGGRHKGDNIAWISNDGNRIQGSLNIIETRSMLRIFSTG